jgi:hypothetical protein
MQMDPHDSTVANADLWSRYFQEQWSPWLSPLGAQGRPVADGTAARVASFLTLVAAGPIAWLYSANNPSVLQITPPARDVPAHRAEHEESAA